MEIKLSSIGYKETVSQLIPRTITPMNHFDLYNTKIAFSHKKDKQLKKERMIFKLLSLPFLSRVGMKLTEFLAKNNLAPYPLLKYFFFNHFCGGETLKEAEERNKYLDDYEIKKVFFYSVEGNKSGEELQNVIDQTIQTFHQKSQPPLYSALKLTGLITPSILEKKQSNKELASNEKKTFNDFEENLDAICQEAHKTKTHFMIDAEESWIQETIDSLCLEKMKQYNKDYPTIYTTIQMYRNDKLEHLKELISLAKKENFYLGVKIVRGAYLAKENDWALKNNQKKLIHDTKKDTDLAYNKALEICFENLDHVALFSGTHNLDSMKIFAKLYHENKQKNSYLMTSQLYGMCDHLTFNLAHHKIPTSKCIPFGPINKVLPYLMRRAEENQSVLGETNRELMLLEKELKRRKKEIEVN